MEAGIFIFFATRKKEICPLLIGILSFYKHILPRNIRLMFVIREKNVLFTFTDHNIDMGKGDDSEMFYAH